MIIIHYLKLMNCLWINIQLKLSLTLVFVCVYFNVLLPWEFFFNLGLDIYIDLRSGIDTLFK